MKLSSDCTFITNGQLIDGTGAPAVPKATLVIEGGRISYAGPTSSAPRSPPDAQKLDANGGTIMAVPWGSKRIPIAGKDRATHKWFAHRVAIDSAVNGFLLAVPLSPRGTMGRMSEKRKSAAPLLVAAFFISLPVLYAASIGPAAWSMC